MNCKEKIQASFREMFCEMPFDRITVKDLAARAGISRKTFYNHYHSLEQLLTESLDSYRDETKDYDRMKDTDPLTRIFMSKVEEYGAFGEHLWGDANNYYFYYLSTRKTVKDLWPDRHRKADIRERCYENIVLHYIQRTTMRVYRSWLADGKPVPMKELTDRLVEMLCEGLLPEPCGDPPEDRTGSET